MIRIHLRKMYKFIYKQISHKFIYKQISHMTIFLYCFYMRHCDFRLLWRQRANSTQPLFSRPWFKKTNFWHVWSQLSLDVFIHFRQDIYHSNRLVTANFWKKKWRSCHMHFKSLLPIWKSSNDGEWLNGCTW